MYANYMFPFKLTKEVGFGRTDDGDVCEAFIKIGLNNCKKEITAEKYREMHIGYVEPLSKQFSCDPKYIIPITGDEYEENNNEDDE